jgi:predicted porin
MNKKILAAAALAIVSGSAMADGASLYGIIDASVTTISNYDSKNSNFTGMQDGLWLPSLWGIHGSEDLGDGMKADYDLQSNLTITNGNAAFGTSQLFDRNATVGISGDFGRVSAGERLDPIWLQSIVEQAMGVHHSGSAAIASLGYQGGGCATLSTCGKNSYGTSTIANVMSANWLYYEAPKMIDNVSISAGYQFGNVAGQTSSLAGTYLGGAYSKGGLTVNLGAESQNNSDNSSRLNRVLVGAMYSMNGWTVEAQEMRSSTSGVSTVTKVDANIGQVGLAYDLTPKLKVGAQYVFINDNVNNARPSITSVSAIYSLSARTKLYMQIENNNPAKGYGGYGVGYSSEGTSTTSNSSLVGIGMTHYF